MTKQYFEIGAKSMGYTGMPAVPRIFPVKAIETNTVGGRGFDAFVTLDTSGDAEMMKCDPSGEWCGFAARGRFVTEAEYLAQQEEQSAVCDGVNVVATSSYKTGHVYSDGKEQRAIAYTINGKAVISLPARLNGGRIPDLDECADIVSGWSVEDAMKEFNRANVAHADALDRFTAACIVTSDTELTDAQFDALSASVRREVARRVSLAKPDMAPRLDAPGPYEDSRVIMDRVSVRLDAQRAGFPFDEYGIA